MISVHSLRLNWIELMIVFPKVTLNYPSYITCLAGKPRLAWTTHQKVLWTSAWLMGHGSGSPRPCWRPESISSGCSYSLALALALTLALTLSLSLYFSNLSSLDLSSKDRNGITSWVQAIAKLPPMLYSLGFFSSKSLVSCILLSKAWSLWQIFCGHPPGR